MEFFLVDLVTSVLERVVEPVKQVKKFDSFLEQLIIYLHALNNVQSQDILELHNKLVSNSCGQKRQELDCRRVFAQISLLSLFNGHIITEDESQTGKDFLSDSLAHVVSGLLV